MYVCIDTDIVCTFVYVDTDGIHACVCVNTDSMRTCVHDVVSVDRIYRHVMVDGQRRTFLLRWNCQWQIFFVTGGTEPSGSWESRKEMQLICQSSYF
jgi:hypothetical protein